MPHIRIGSVVSVKKGRLKGRVGKVVGVRGDKARGIPYYNVFIFNLNNKGGLVYPIPSDNLNVERRK